MKAKVYISLKEGILDPQGKAVEHALDVLGFKGIKGLRIGKYLEIDLNAETRDAASRDVKDMCEKLLANTVIETYRFEIEP